MRRHLVPALLAALMVAALGAAADAGQKSAKSAGFLPPQKDCTPVNGRYGYYGNPWCDTGSYRIGDYEFQRSPNDIRRFANGQQKR